MPMAVKLLRAGEESGRLRPCRPTPGRRLRRAGVDLRLQRIVAILEPTLVIVLGILVGGIVMSILTAVISVNDLAI